MSGLCVQKAFTWMASEQDLIPPRNHFWTTSKRQDVAIQWIIPAVMQTVTMKMSLFHSTTKVGVNARRMVITWPVSTKVTAMNLNVLTSSDAVNIYWEEIVEMVSFELGEELRKMFFRLVTSVGWRKILRQDEKTSFLIYWEVQMLKTVIILLYNYFFIQKETKIKKDFLGESLISQSCDASEVRLKRF